jgi:uncharacterized membrane protein
MNLTRLARHFLATRVGTRRYFTPQVCDAIETAIREIESRHAGEIRFVIETALEPPDAWRDLPSRRRAVQLFGQLGVWDTAQNNGVLIYVLMADRVVEIVADRGISAHITQSEWDGVCRQMELHYREGRFAEGSTAGVHGVGRLIARHFPAGAAASVAGTDELPNQPLLL